MLPLRFDADSVTAIAGAVAAADSSAAQLFCQKASYPLVVKADGLALGKGVIIAKNPWEAQAVFNPAAIYLEGKVHLLYRALANDNTSVFGYANSTDFVTIKERLPFPVYVPREPFEQKNVPGGNSTLR